MHNGTRADAPLARQSQYAHACDHNNRRHCDGGRRYCVGVMI
jgi:hypothetical protein